MTLSSTSPPAPQILFHLGYRLPSDLHRLLPLRPTRFLLLCGSTARAHKIASKFSPSTPPKDLCLTDRYTLLVPTPGVAVASHGIGNASIDVLLHELHQALTISGARDWCMIRIGSCGGVGVDEGSVVVSKKVVNGVFQQVWRLFVLGREIVHEAELDGQLGRELFEYGKERLAEKCVSGDTFCAETFYEAQGRRDGAFVGFSGKQRREFLEICQKKGVVNFEMEGLALAAFAKRTGVPAAIVCAVLVDRLVGETPMSKEGQLKGYEERAIGMVVAFVKDKLKGAGE